MINMPHVGLLSASMAMFVYLILCQKVCSLKYRNSMKMDFLYLYYSSDNFASFLNSLQNSFELGPYLRDSAHIAGPLIVKHMSIDCCSKEVMRAMHSSL